MERLFVYGTLAPGRVNHHIVENIPGSWESATVTGKLIEQGWGADMGYPGIILEKDGDEVSGFLFSSQQLSKHWPMLDEFEGSGYKRELVKVKVANEKMLEAYVYSINQSD